MWAVLFLKTYTFLSSIKLLPGDGNVWDFFFFLLHLLSFGLHTPEVISVG